MSRIRTCSIKDCKSKGDKVPLHPVPTGIKRLEKWKKALKLFLDDKLDENTVICSKHFKKTDYIPSVTGSQPLLCKSAVPSIFPTNMPKKQPQVEVVVRPRHQSRRAASKEALKQMQILLEDENDAVEIPDDDDVIPLAALSPPKKKYKLTHRKSSDGNDREVLVLKSITPNITNHYVENNLELECWVEELEPCQKERNKKLEEEEKALQSKLDELIKACKGEVVYKGDLTTVIEVSEHVQKTIQAVQASVNKPPIVLNNAVANPQPGYQLVMDPRLGLIVGTVNSPNKTPSKQQGKIQVATNLQAPVTPTSQTPPVSNRRSRTKKQTPVVHQESPPPPRPGPSPISTRSTPSAVTTRSTPSAVTTRSSPAVNTRAVVNTKQTNKRTASQPPVAAPPATRSRRDPAPVANARPTETSVEGGLTTGTNAKPKAIVDLTTDDGRPLPDSKEISFNKLQGKTFPSLVVVARPHLRVTDVNSDRSKLDAKVKSVLMYAPTKFTEWLIQQGLVKSEQKCSIHTATQLKLGMYSDVSKFPYSGGYVWISECCPQRFVSVFSGSIFEGSPHPPLVILKILYHWSCQTNIQNVTQWVKVDNLYVKGMYTWLRSICSVALHTHIRQLGGPQTKVEVGVISLGTTSQDGNSRQVKVEVLGILEAPSKLIRLRAIEPLADGDRNYKKRFSKILEPLAQWVHPSSIIVTDLTVDKATLHQMGFSTVIQTTSVDANNSNRTIMEYLRRIVPRMFQNTLSLLSRQIIQQFLDELVWREWFGTTSMQAFDNLIAHLAEQTRFESNQSLIVKLNRVALNPFKNWGIPATSSTTVPAAVPSPATKAADSAAKKRKRKEPEPPKLAPPKPAPPKPAPAPTPEVNRPPKSTSPDVPEQMVPLENYYYGTIDNYPPKTNVTLNMKCPFCKETFNNNIVLMSHLFKHAHNVSQDGQMCRYCLTSVPTANDLLKHIATAHPAETKHDNGFVCLICETQYMNPFVLGKHMSKEHCPSELPYQCGTCGYKCSNHKQAIDHFYKQHDNGPTIQCPFCLKSTTVFSASRNITQNMHYFIQHLQKHQRKQFAKRCGKCNLWFVQKDVLKDHQTKMHASQRGKTGLVPWIAPRNGVMVPKSKMDKYPCDAEGINFSTLFYNVSKNLKCKECDGLMDTPKHFPSFESCQNPNCQYSTCCSNAMQEHNAKCSKNSQPNVPEEKLPHEMFCICGYSSEDGNQLARHLAVCERKSAYPSLSDAKSASVTHSMLDVLGLVRKPDETEKKQTAVTRNIKRVITKTESEPETITLDEDESDILDVKNKKIKKDTTDNSKTEVKTDGTEKVSESVGVVEANVENTSALEVSEDSEQVNMDHEQVKEVSQNANQDVENVDKESTETNQEVEQINQKPEENVDKESAETNQEVEQINQKPEDLNKEKGILNDDSQKEEGIEKETDIIEKDELVQGAPLDSEAPANECDERLKEVSDINISEKGQLNIKAIETLDVVENPESQPTATEENACHLKNQDKDMDIEQSKTPENEDIIRENENDDSDVQSDKKESLLPEALDEQSQETKLTEEAEVELSLTTETKGTEESVEQADANQFDARKNDEVQPTIQGEEIENEAKVSQDIEETEITQEEDNQNLEKPADLEENSVPVEENVGNTDQNRLTSDDVEKNEINDGIRSEIINSNANQESECSTADGEGHVEEMLTDKLQNISDKYGEDLSSSIQGVYDDVSEGSDNAASKYLEDPDTSILNLGESEQSGAIVAPEVENSERVLEPMDYEDISNTGLESLTSMETD